jgi:hypothetical protein
MPSRTFGDGLFIADDARTHDSAKEPADAKRVDNPIEFRDVIRDDNLPPPFPAQVFQRRSDILEERVSFGVDDVLSNRRQLLAIR